MPQSQKMSGKQIEKRLAASKGSYTPGELIPMHEFQREFYKLHGMFVYNPEMEAIMATDPETDKKANFGSTPLPWQRPMNSAEILQMNAAKSKLFKCKDEKCGMFDKDAVGKYILVLHKKEVPHHTGGDPEVDKILNQMDSRRFGRREHTCFHVAVHCRACGKLITYVKYNLANRRAAEDPTVSGPHQFKERN